MNLYLIIIYAIVFLALIIVIVKTNKLTRKKAKIPGEAVSIGPDNYMKVWATSNRINFVFRNIPEAKICFDRRVAKDLAEWMKALD